MSEHANPADESERHDAGTGSPLFGTGRTVKIFLLDKQKDLPIGRSFLMITTAQSNPSFLITGYSSSEIKKILRICSAYALRLLLH